MSNEKTLKKGSFLWRFSKKFNFAADKVIPESFVFALILTVIVFVLALFLTDSGVMDIISYWFGGLWSMIAFAFQMTIMVVLTSMAAKSPQLEKVLSKIGNAPKTTAGAYAVLIIFATVASWINWAFGTILAPVLAMYLSKNIKKLHFPLMIAAGYACMIMVQPICPSISAVALLATPGHFMADTIGVLPVSETAFNPLGIIMVAILFVVTLIITIKTTPPDEEVVSFTGDIQLNGGKEIEEPRETFADKMNNGRIIIAFFAVVGIAYVIYHFVTGNGLTLNFIIFLFLLADIILYKTPKRFVDAVKENMHLAANVMIQFPFYGGIMGVMASTGLTSVIANGLVFLANDVTIYWVSYLSASIVNLFVPSQGGQWIVQGPILYEAASAFNAHMPSVVTAFMLGDEATNLIQPLYVIPALALVDIKLKKVWGFMAFIWFIWFIATTIGLIVLPIVLG
ncbi:MAG: TIGR00366 family protein [Spirochaetales bacterium]|uniref:TIGR00366 family protein n=1 Tax=Candidatus Thalassospirochaeta sargassi TaxID=3119039 RepID=A0AAJ1IFM7_9SPIO|nr:TIGR00366 family protein [Spirochaetales bacterium]